MRVACLQLTTKCDPQANLADIRARVGQAVSAGAQLVALPETCNFMEKRRDAMQARATSQTKDIVAIGLAELAQHHKIWLLAGSLVLAGEGGKAVNRSLVFAPDGALAASYDKIHMFDVTLENGETHAESASYQAGAQLAIADLQVAKLGLSVCYDVRFPALYRQLALAGAQIISVPSAFTRPTGAAHWHILLRARAIETGCFIIAPAQCGQHENGRATYGHSLIVSAWGEVLADAGADGLMAMADLDLAQCAKARQQIATLQHGRGFKNPSGAQCCDD